MSNITKMILSLVVMAAVIGYTVFNFLRGQISMTYFLVFMAILCIPFLNMINLLIQELKNR